MIPKQPPLYYVSFRCTYSVLILDIDVFHYRWIITKCVSPQARLQETLHFLLDHPRRCFVYLFPSHQTWFLLAFLAILTVTDWISFLILDIGNPEIMRIPVGQRLLVGLLQSAAVRASGFSVVSLSALAPGVQ